MTLFDGKPPPEREVALRRPCVCEHSYGAHRGGTNCTKCDCEEFVAKDENGGDE